MPQNLIRLKQLEQSELTGLMQNVISSNQYTITYGGTGININSGSLNLSGVGVNFIDSIVSGGATGYFSNLFVNGQTVLTGNVQGMPEIYLSTPTGYLSGINYSGNYDGGYIVTGKQIGRAHV